MKRSKRERLNIREKRAGEGGGGGGGGGVKWRIGEGRLNKSAPFNQDEKFHLVFSLHDPLNSFRRQSLSPQYCLSISIT